MLRLVPRIGRARSRKDPDMSRIIMLSTVGLTLALAGAAIAHDRTAARPDGGERKAESRSQDEHAGRPAVRREKSEERAGRGEKSLHRDRPGHKS